MRSCRPASPRPADREGRTECAYGRPDLPSPTASPRFEFPSRKDRPETSRALGPVYRST